MGVCCAEAVISSAAHKSVQNELIGQCADGGRWQRTGSNGRRNQICESGRRLLRNLPGRRRRFGNVDGPTSVTHRLMSDAG
jgi:hypothetical protein